MEKLVTKKYGGPWYSRYAERTQFEESVFERFPGMAVVNIRKGKKLWREYRLDIKVPTFEHHAIIIEVFPDKKKTPRVTTNSVDDSPHRYDCGCLCIWYPWDSKDQRWSYDDGLLHLLVLIEAHLFKEAWWRLCGEWLGPEVPHGTDSQSVLQ